MCAPAVSSFALVPGSSVLKMEPKSLFTFWYVDVSASFFFWSSSSITAMSFDLSVLDDLLLLHQILVLCPPP